MKKVYAGMLFFIVLLFGGAAFAGSSSGQLLIINNGENQQPINVGIYDTTNPSMGCNPSQMTIGSQSQSTTSCTWNSFDRGVIQVAAQPNGCRFTSFNGSFDDWRNSGGRCHVTCLQTGANFRITCY